MSPVVIQPIDPDSEATAKQLVMLADANKRTLGFLPEMAIRERAQRGTVLVAADGDTLAGYALFDLPGDQIRLIHLCVRDSYRGQQIARSLVQRLRELHSSRRGIIVRCRRDWPANGMWKELAFTPRRDVPGRGKDRMPLTVWWLGFDQPDLFTNVDDVDRLVVAMDTNVFNDLHSNKVRPGQEESQTLQAPWIEDETELVVTSELINELDRTDDPQLRNRLVRAANDYRMLRARPDETAAAASALLLTVEPVPLATDESLPDDARLIAAAAIGGADVYLTRDTSALDAFALPAADQLGLQVLRPSDLAVHLDSIKDGSQIAERRLHESRVIATHWPKRPADHLAALINPAAGETRGQFNTRIRALANRRTPTGLRLLLDDDGHAIAAVATEHNGPQIDVPIARIAIGQALTKAAAGQIPLLLRREVVIQGARRVSVIDTYAQRLVVEALLRDGFVREADGALSAMAIDAITTQAELAEMLPGHRGMPRMDDAAGWASLEHELWPLKVEDSGLPCYMVPIQPAFASRLFGTDLTLLDRDPQLALGREHVYYRAPIQSLSAPGRILWYVSSPNREVIGCSQAVSVHVDTPEHLHERFRHLGVWDLAAVRRSAKRGLVSAVRFRGTQIFENPVSLPAIRQIAADGGLEPLQSPRRIEASHFLNVYRKGRGH